MKELKEIYQKHWKDLAHQIHMIDEDEAEYIKPSSPLLLSLDEEKYSETPCRIMIFGRVKNEWSQNFVSDIDTLMWMYEQYYQIDNVNEKETSPFWHFHNDFVRKIDQKKFGSVCSVWNNIIKIGSTSKTISFHGERLYDIENRYFNVISEEIELLNPNIILFLTGPNYDQKIMNSLPGARFHSCGNRFLTHELAKIEYKGIPNIFRTYHPHRLFRNRIKVEVLSTIIDNLTLESQKKSDICREINKS